MTMHTIRFPFMTLLLSGCLTTAFVMAADLDPIPFFTADGQAPRGAWVSGAGGGTAARETDPPRITMTLRRRGEQAWLTFNDHQHLNVAALDVDETHSLHVRLHSENPFAGSLWWGWIGHPDHGEERSAAPETPLDLAADTSIELMLPVPRAPRGGRAARLFLEVDRPAQFNITALALVNTRRVRLDDVSGSILLQQDTIPLSGTVEPGVDVVELLVRRLEPQDVLLEQRRIDVRDGRFEATISKDELAEHGTHQFIARIPGSTEASDTSRPVNVFVYPPFTALGPDDALTVRDAQIKTLEGRRIGLWGVNLFQTHLHWSRRQNPEDYRTELRKIAAAGFNAVRMPLNMGYFVPAQGVYPDDPRYDDILRSHGLPTGALAFYDGLIEEAGRLGLYVIPEFHELPSNPYRWFVGGHEADRGTGKPGTAIAWMTVEDDDGRHRLDIAKARTEIPEALGWLARHWRGVPNIAGIEVPWNEPLGPLTEPEPFFDLVEACAAAVKQGDPERLVFLCTVDWGAMVNVMPDESLWKLPEQVDVLFPHFYPGLHSNDSGEDGTWSTTMASWAAWMAGAGKPVMIGEYGVVEMHRGQYWRGEITETQKAVTYSACAAQWHAQGIQGLFAWAWQGGLDQSDTTGRLTNGAHVLPLWADAYRNMDQPPLTDAKVAVVLTRSRRAAYGARRDLWRVSDALLDAHLTPFAAVFDTQIAAEPEVLQRFDGLVILTADLPDTVLETAVASGKPTFRLGADLAGLDAVIMEFQQLLDAARPPAPAHVLTAAGATQLTLFERRGLEGPVRIHATPTQAQGLGRLVAEDGEIVFEGDAATLTEQGVVLEMTPWQTLRLTWQADR